MQSVNPATGELLREYPRMSLDNAVDIAGKVASVARAWQREPLEQRATALFDLERELLRGKRSLAELMAKEMGKPVTEGIAEIEKCAKVCSFYAENGPGFLEPQQVATEAHKSYVTYQPLGVVLAIMPWNFPFWQVLRFAAGALLTGNGVIVKHASNVSGCSFALEELFVQAGLPRDLVRSVFLEQSAALDLIDDSNISAVTLTGSTRAGRQVAARAGHALKKTVLELGGSDAYVVLADADIATTSAICVKSRLINAGQSCIAAKRFVVVPEVREAFEQAMLEALAKVRQGDPLSPKTDIGPLARVDLRDRLHEQVRASIERGAKLLMGGEVPEKVGAWYPPTLLTDVQPTMPAYAEELFGPVAAILPAEDEEHALHIANDTAFGLGAAVFTSDRERGEQIAKNRLQAGSCFVNSLVRSDPRLPFGGIKDSGYGRELGPVGIREFTNVKTVWVA